MFWILITRYCRPKTVWSFAEKLIFPPSTATWLNFTSWAASAEPLSEPCARLIAMETPSIASAPPRKPPVPGAAPAALSERDHLAHAVLGSSPNTEAYVTK